MVAQTAVRIEELLMAESREALTIRFPAPLLAKARDLKSERESLNDFVVEAVDREVRRRQGLEVFDNILRLSDAIEARTGPHPDSTDLIRALREGSARGE